MIILKVTQRSNLCSNGSGHSDCDRQNGRFCTNNNKTSVLIKDKEFAGQFRDSPFLKKETISCLNRFKPF